MRFSNKTLCLGVLASCAHFGAVLAETAPPQRLSEQAQYWQGRGRSDLAVQAWNKLLLSDPDHAEALIGLGTYEAQAGRADQAEAYLARLAKAHPGHPGIKRVQQAMEMGKLDPNLLSDARRLAQAGQADEAVTRYRRLLSGTRPRGDLALEYYQTVGGTRGGWDEAREGLAALVAEEPDEPRYTLALAQHLTYRDSTRRQGIKMLSALSQKPGVGKQAKAAWRQGLIWLWANVGDAALFRAYLAQDPKDQAVRQRLTEIIQSSVIAPPADRFASRRDQGFRALQRGDPGTAEARFQQILKDSPKDADALGGLGVVRLRQQRFAEAQALLQRAAASPGGRAKWGQALANARFWDLMDQAKAARQAGTPERSEQLLEQAMKIAPREEAAQLAMADLLFERGRLQAAEERYRQIIQRSPKNIDAIRGLIGVLALQQRDDEAVEFYDRLTPAQQQGMGNVGALRTKRMRAEAKQAVAKGDYASARSTLEEALQLDPDNPWTRLELARIYQHEGQQEKAGALMESLTATDPARPEALYAKALLSAENGEWQEGLAALERIPPGERTVEMKALQRRLQINTEVERAAGMVRKGQTRAARGVLKQFDTAAADDPDLVGARALDEQITEIRAPYASNIAAGMSFRRRSGEDGLSRLYNFELPLQARFAVGDRGSITLRAVPVTVDAGDLDLGDISKARRFGSNSLELPPGGGSVSQRETGVALGAAYHVADWRFDIGTTPINFPVVDAVGGVRWRPSYGRFSLDFDLSRRAVTESVLSYSGTRDTRTGDVWGGVRSLGGRVGAAYDFGEHGIYASAGYRTLSGKRVASNNQWELGGGWYRHIWNEPERRLTSGVNLTTYGFQKNLGSFTLGHGGYFSPKTYVAVGVPLELVGRSGRLSYQARGAVGVQHFKISDSPFFPNDPDLQSALQARAVIDPTLATAHSGSSRTGIGYSLMGALEYRLAPHWHVGGQLGFDNARGFNQQAGLIFLRYWFEPQTKPIYFPPRPVAPFYVGDPG
jgi:tetratricopeptide (TPR) repeat protein